MPRSALLLSVATPLLFCCTPPPVVEVVPPDRPDEAATGCTILEGGRVLTAAKADFETGYVVFDKGLVVAVGEGAFVPGSTAPARASCRVVDTRGFVVTPGLIDTHSHLGVYPWPEAAAHADGNEMTQPATPDVRAEEAVWPQDPGFQRALQGGVTTMHVLPGSGNLIGGRGVTLHNLPRRSAMAMRLPGAPDSLKMACGENPKRTYGQANKGAPMTRMGNLRGQRKAFRDAKKAKPDDLGLGDETLRGVMAGTILLQVHCYRADEMVAFLGMADELPFKVRSFHHALEAYKISDILAKREVAISTWADWWGFKLEAWDGIPENAALLLAAGARVNIHSDSPFGIQRLNQEAAKAMASGNRAGIPVTPRDALSWITMNPAWTLGIDGQVGSLEVGKRADVVVWNRDLFSVYASPKWVWVDGRLVHDSDHPGAPWSDFEVEVP